MFAPKSRCFPENQASIVLPLVDRVVSASRGVGGPPKYPATKDLTGPAPSWMTRPTKVNISRRPPANRPSRYATTRNPCAHHLNVCAEFRGSVRRIHHQGEVFLAG